MGGRHVQFNESVQVWKRDVGCSQEHQTETDGASPIRVDHVWYTAEELELIRRSRRETVAFFFREVAKGSQSAASKYEDFFCLRGLEELMSKEARIQTFKIRSKVVSAVLFEQSRLHDSDDRPLPERIRQRVIKYSSLSAREALVRASLDALEARSELTKVKERRSLQGPRVVPIKVHAPSA